MKTNKAVILFTIFLSILAVVGCSGGNNPPAETASAQQPAQTQTAAQPETNSEPTIYEQRGVQSISINMLVPASAIEDLLPEDCQLRIISSNNEVLAPMWMSINRTPTENMPIRDNLYHQFLLGTVVEFQGVTYAYPVLRIVDDAFVHRVFPQLTPERALRGQIEFTNEANFASSRVIVENTTLINVKVEKEGPVQTSEGLPMLVYRYIPGNSPQDQPRLSQLHTNKMGDIVIHDQSQGNIEIQIDTDHNPVLARLKEFRLLDGTYQRRDYSFIDYGLKHDYLAGLAPTGDQALQNKPAFPADFPVITDQGGLGKGSAIGGFGGSTELDREQHRKEIQASGRRPVVLIHGNGTPSVVWQDAVWPGSEPVDFSIQKGLKEAGYPDSHIWALSYQGERGTLDGERANMEPARSNIADVRAFIDAVLEYTGASQVDIIAVSMGCHMTRGYLLGFQADGSFNPSDRRLDKVAHAILVSGANYGLGRSNSEDWNSHGRLFSTDPAIAGQNNFMLVDGQVDLTPGDVQYYTISAEYDFTQAMYEYTGGNHPLKPEHTSRLG
ncbi:MAG: hypothetical protein D6B26_04955, partial [Spirochaetaceae bacterium]